MCPLRDTKGAAPMFPIASAFRDECADVTQHRSANPILALYQLFQLRFARRRTEEMASGLHAHTLPL